MSGRITATRHPSGVRGLTVRTGIFTAGAWTITGHCGPSAHAGENWIAAKSCVSASPSAFFVNVWYSDTRLTVPISARSMP